MIELISILTLGAVIVGALIHGNDRENIKTLLEGIDSESSENPEIEEISEDDFAGEEMTWRFSRGGKRRL